METSFDRWVKLALGACKEPLHNCSGDDKMLTAQNELREPDVCDDINIKGRRTTKIFNVGGFIEISIFVIFYH